MKLNHLHWIEEGIERIAAVTDTDTAKIIEGLTGVAWDEEDAVRIREFMIDALADESRDRRGARTCTREGTNTSMHNEQHSKITDEARARISKARRAVAVADQIFGGRMTPVDMASLAAMIDDGLREGHLEVTESGTIRAIPPGWKGKEVPRCRGFRILAVRETGDGMSVESCQEEDAEFFGLYGVGQDGEDSHVGDFKTRQAAEEALLAVGGFFLGRSLGFRDLEEIMMERIPSGGVK